MTANAIYGAKESYLQEGFCDYLSKPIDYEQLEEVIVKWLPEHKVQFVERSAQGEESDIFDMLEKKCRWKMRSSSCLKNTGLIWKPDLKIWAEV